MCDAGSGSPASLKWTQAPRAVWRVAIVVHGHAVHRGCGVTWVAPSAAQIIARTTPGATCSKTRVPRVSSLRRNSPAAVTWEVRTYQNMMQKWSKFLSFCLCSGYINPPLLIIYESGRYPQPFWAWRKRERCSSSSRNQTRRLVLEPYKSILPFPRICINASLQS